MRRKMIVLRGNRDVKKNGLLLLLILAFVVLFGSPTFSVASTFTLVSESDFGVNISATFKNNDGSTLYSGDVYTGYHLNTDKLGTLDAFCVENAFSQNGSTYELLPVPTNLQQAASLAHNFWSGSNQSDLDRAIVQVAIWELVLGSSKFQYVSGLDDGSLALVSSLVENPGMYTGGNMSWAHNGGLGMENLGSQDYLVNASVPIPSSLYLLGAGVVGLVAVRRSSKSKHAKSQ